MGLAFFILRVMGSCCLKEGTDKIKYTLNVPLTAGAEGQGPRQGSHGPVRQSREETTTWLGWDGENRKENEPEVCQEAKPEMPG